MWEKQDKKIKILYINGSFTNDSGCGVIARDTYRIMEKKGYDVELFCSKDFLPEEHRKYEYLFPEDYNTAKKYIKNIIKYYYNYKSAQNLKKVISDYKPDIIHIHSLIYSSMTYAVLKPCIKSKVPIIMTQHNTFLVCPMMTLTKGNEEKCDKILCKGYNKLPCFYNNCAPNGFEQSFRWGLFSFICKLTGYDKHVTLFTTPSQALKDLLVQADIGVTEDKVSVIHNFLCMEDTEITPVYTNKGYFLYIGRLSKEKGVSYLLQAFNGLPKNIKLHISGSGQEEKFLKKYVEDNKMDNVIFIGQKNKKELYEEIKNCIATILPSNCFETFGMANIESFIHGKPVIASNIGGIPEIVEHNKTGLLFEPKDIETLRAHILKYWNNNELVICHGKNGYKKAIEKFTYKTCLDKLDKIYKELDENSKVSTY